MSERHSIFLQIEVVSLAEARALQDAIVAALPEGDGLKLNPPVEVVGVHQQTGFAEIRADSEQQAIAALRGAFAEHGLEVVDEQRTRGGDKPVLVVQKTEPQMRLRRQ